MAQHGYAPLTSPIPEGPRFCNRCGNSLAPPGLFCSACGHGSGQAINNNMPSMHQMIQSGSTDSPQLPPAYEYVAAPTPQYEHVASPSAPMIMGQPMQPYQPTMSQPYLQGGLPMGTPMGGIPMGSPLGQPGVPMLPMGQPLGQPYAMMGMPLGQPIEQKGPAYPSPGLPDPTQPPAGDWKAMRSPYPVLTVPPLWRTKEVSLSLMPHPKKDHEIRCLQFLHEPGVALPEGLDVTNDGKLIGQPTTPMCLKEFYFMGRLQMGLSVAEKARRKTRREKEHAKLVKSQKKQHEQMQRKDPKLRPFEEPPMPLPDPEETDEVKWVLFRIKIGVLTYMESFLVATFCRGVPCLFASPIIEEGQCWVAPCVCVPTLPFGVIIDLPCKLVALFYLLLALPFYAVLGLFNETFPESLNPAIALATGCCSGIDQEDARQQMSVQMAQARVNR